MQRCKSVRRRRAHVGTGDSQRGAGLVAAVGAAELLNGLVRRPRQLQRQVAPPPLVLHPAQCVDARVSAGG